MKNSLIKSFIITCFLIFNQAYSQYTKLLDLTGNPEGRTPSDALFSDGTFLYGTSYYDGTNGLGTIFRILPDGSGYVKLFDFAGITSGSYPVGSLISDGTFLYGMTEYGGTFDKGTVFKIMPDGTGFAKLLDFEGFTNGRDPYGSLICDGTFLYGMNTLGGTNNFGTIFKLKTDGTSYLKLLDFAGTSNGKYPQGSLISDGVFLYGMTWRGGTNDLGTIFKITTNGTGYLKLLDFEGTSNGSYPRGSLFSDGTFLYGMTYRGGTNDLGTIFKVMTSGSGYNKLLDFNGAINGSSPRGNLISDGTFLYGTTEEGGVNNLGSVFKLMPDGTNFVKLHDFSGVNGSFPHGSFIFDGNFLYGTTSYGGVNSFGVVFKYCLTPIAAPTASVYEQPTCGIPTGSVAVTDPIPALGITYTLTGTMPYIAPITNTTGIFSGLTVGNYELTTALSGCTSIATSLTVNPVITIVATPSSLTIQQGETVQLNATGATTYNWTPPTGLSDPTASNPIASPITTTIYTVTGFDSDGCFGMDSTTITVNLVCGEVYVPTIFSPDEGGPSKNNTLCVFAPSGCIKEMTFSIYNLWGEKVFETFDQNICWNGMYKDNPLNSGVYIYNLLITLSDNTSTEKTGNITLVR
jgi:gliding motility-associated-like protein